MSAAYEKLQEAWLKISPIEKGDEIMVTRVANSYEMGWGLPWVYKMNELVGMTLKVREVKGDLGVVVENPWPTNLELPKEFFLPVFVTTRVGKSKPLSFKISDEYRAEILWDGSVEVGCQNVPYSLLTKIYEAATAQITQ